MLYDTMYGIGNSAWDIGNRENHALPTVVYP